MKTIKLHSEADWSDADLLRIVAETPPGDRGMNLDHMRRSLRVLDALDAAKDGALSLEDADHAFLLQKLEVSDIWRKADRRILDMADRVKNAA